MVTMAKVQEWVSQFVAGWVNQRFFPRSVHRSTRIQADTNRKMPIITNDDGYVDVTFLNSTPVTEFIADTVGAMVTGNTETGITVTYQDADNTIDFVIDTETIQDIIGAMLTGNTETNITVTYQDADGTIDFVVPALMTTEEVQDIVGAMLTGNTETNITVTYQDTDGTIDFVVATNTEEVQDIVGVMFNVPAEPLFTLVYNDTTGKIDITPNINFGFANFFDYPHAHEDAFGGGQLDHGGALTGLGDDDHTQYLLANGSRALSAEWDIGEDMAIRAERIEARDIEGLRIEDDAGNLGIYVEDGGQVEITNTNYPVLRVERTTAVTNSDLGVAEFLATSSGDMTDGFGSDILFAIKDSAAVVNRLAAIAAIRDGADNTGSLKISTYAAGSQTSRIFIDGGGSVGIGTTSPASTLEVNGTLGVNGDSTFSGGENVFIADGSTTGDNQIELRSARTFLNATDLLVGGIQVRSNDTTLTAPGTIVATMQAVAEASHTSTVLDTAWRWFVTTGTTFYEAMQLSSAGVLTVVGLNLGEDTMTVYDEGTWSPAITGTTNPTVTYTTQTGWYTQVGNVVHYQASITINTVSGGTGSARFSIPVTSKSGKIQLGSASTALSGTASNGVLSVASATTYGNINIGAATAVQCSALAAGDQIFYGGSYLV